MSADENVRNGCEQTTPPERASADELIRELGTPHVETTEPWWIGAPSRYAELRPEVAKMCREWRDEGGDPEHLADWLLAMLDVGVKRAERDTAAAIHARYKAVATDLERARTPVYDGFHKAAERIRQVAQQ